MTDVRGDLEFGTIPGLLAVAAVRHGARVAIEDGPVNVTYAALEGLVNRAARALMAVGTEPGDRVAIWAPNRWEWIVAALATHAVGAVLVPLNTRYKGGEAAWILAKSEARVLFAVPEFLGADYFAMLEGESLPALRTRIVLTDAAVTRAGVLAWSSFIEAGVGVPESDRKRRAEAVSPRRSLGSTLHVGDDRQAEGGHVYARADASRVP